MIGESLMDISSPLTALYNNVHINNIQMQHLILVAGNVGVAVIAAAVLLVAAVVVAVVLVVAVAAAVTVSLPRMMGNSSW